LLQRFREDNERKEKLVLSVDCQLVTLMSVIKGRLVISTTHAYFHDLTPITEDCDRHDFKVRHCKILLKV
jgi:hypothetical protein